MLHAIDRIRTYQVNGTPSESSARHARTIDALTVRRQLDEQIELPATDFVIVTQASVRFVHQLPKACQIATVKRIRGGEYTLILANHMTAPAIHQLRQFIPVAVQIGECDVAQGNDLGQMVSQCPDATLAVCAATVVFARRTLV